MINILLGIAIEAILIVGHHNHWGFVTRFSNAGLDVMTRLSQSVCAEAPRWRRGSGDGGSSAADATVIERWLRCPSAGAAEDIPLLLDVDERTWRSAQWGGGEPALAPRDGVATLVEQSFALGAKRVVLDILVQDGLTRDAAGSADEQFAARLRALLKQPHFGDDRLLLLVRTERAPLLDDINDRGNHFTGAFLPSLRASRAIDSVIAESGGRIALAAPYFTADEHDRMTRDWVLFKVHCMADAGSPTGGWLQFVPSVQLAAAAHGLGVPMSVVSPAPAEADTRTPCRVFPADAEPAALGLKAEQVREELNAALYGPQGEGGAVEAYWARLQRAFNQRLRADGRELGALPEAHSLGNRIVYRYRWGGAPDEDLSTGRVQRRPAREVLDAVASGDARLALSMSQLFAGRTVVIGQTFREANDVFYTPVGTMPGAAVLVNAIDSMREYQLLRATGGALSNTIALVLIVVVGYLFARWDSTTGTITATAIVILSVGVASFFMFQHGVWLDVAAPILGIQLHRLWAGWEERQELKARRAAAGDAHHH